MGRTLYGEVADDPSGRFNMGSYVCTSVIDRIDADAMLIQTASGSVYEVEGSQGKHFNAWLNEVELLRNGYSLQEVLVQRKASL